MIIKIKFMISKIIKFLIITINLLTNILIKPNRGYIIKLNMKLYL